MPAWLSSRAGTTSALTVSRSSFSCFAHATAQDEAVGPPQRLIGLQYLVEVFQPRSSRLRTASDAACSASTPPTSMCPNSVLGSSTPSVNSALPIPVPRVTTITTPAQSDPRKPHLGNTGGVGVVDHPRGATRRGLQRASASVPISRDDVCPVRAALLHHRRQADPEGPRVVEVLDDGPHRLGHRLGRGGLRSGDAVPLAHKTAGVGVDQGTLDARSADVDAQDRHVSSSRLLQPVHRQRL